MSIDLPAPVSPVSTLSPGLNDALTESMTAKLRIRISRSIAQMLGQRLNDLKKYPSEYVANARPT